MLRRKIYSAGLLIYCSLITAGNIQKGSDTGTRNITGIDTSIVQGPVSTPSDFDLNPTALLFAKEYLKKNNWGLERLKKRSGSSLKIINSVFTKYAIPAELKYMAVVESNLNTDTVCNSSGATGIWQLMPLTGLELGLKITDDVDERLHIHKSSAAAAKYLKQLYTEFGDWLLVIAAYNSGPAKVTRAINLSGHNKFWQLQNFLPEETRNYVKRFVSVLYFFEGKSNTAV
ncbi:MAG TPA: lytic transglycosylase domain-containing protein [Chitinophagaceae bacterium]|nr:lytic transglycosylase domain-containing protein [Chitinophagaceae bacterium]